MLNFNKGISLSKAVFGYLEMMEDLQVETFRDGNRNGFIILNKDGNHDKVAYITNGESNCKINIYVGPFSETGISAKAFENKHSFDFPNAYNAACFIANNIAF